MPSHHYPGQVSEISCVRKWPPEAQARWFAQRQAWRDGAPARHAAAQREYRRLNPEQVRITQRKHDAKRAHAGPGGTRRGRRTLAEKMIELHAAKIAREARVAQRLAAEAEERRPKDPLQWWIDLKTREVSGCHSSSLKMS